jgi:hypothetical protein
MKLNKTLPLIVLCVLPTVAHCQVYTENIPVNIAFYVTGLGTGESLNLLGTISETVTINSTAGTIEQAGTISFDAANFDTFSASQTQTITIPAQFPNPPQTVQVPGSITVGLTSDAQTASFDTGADLLNYISPGSWTFNQSSVSIDIPLDLSYSLTTGGQTYTGDWQGDMDPRITLPNQLSTVNYPTSIGLSPAPQTYVPIEQALDFTASNGFVADIDVVPEPNTLALVGVGLSAFGLLHRKW